MKNQAFRPEILNVKYTIGLILVFLISAIAARAQTNTQNYIITKTPRISGIVNDSTLAANASDKTKVQIGIQYVDGLGR
ncbi:MAG TPA: hypothetical protein VK668_08345, partial [Mucilaginibacter sp.]|nr:hypothetical protein [Mucilaginibacter sp.]